MGRRGMFLPTRQVFMKMVVISLLYSTKAACAVSPLFSLTLMEAANWYRHLFPFSRSYCVHLRASSAFVEQRKKIYWHVYCIYNIKIQYLHYTFRLVTCIKTVSPVFLPFFFVQKLIINPFIYNVLYAGSRSGKSRHSNYSSSFSV